MATWTKNTITLRNAEISKRYLNGEGILDFNYIIPQPTKQEDCPAEFLNAEIKDQIIYNEDGEVVEFVERPWFNETAWNFENWGCDTNALECTVTEEEGRTIIQFNTIPGAPERIFEKMCQQYPNEVIKFYAEFKQNEYGELGQSYPLTFKNQDGELVIE